MELTSENVIKLFKSCIYTKDEKDTSYKVVVHGILCDSNFKKSLIEKNKPQIKKMLLQLDSKFLKSTGSKGWTFLHTGKTKHGNQWTQAYLIMEMLVALGLAAGLVEITFARELWKNLSGGVPYFVINDK